MNNSYLSGRDLRLRIQRHSIRMNEIPTEFEVSVPVPTLRWNDPAFAMFAASAARSPGSPPRVGPPDRWWALHAVSGHLLGYALCKVAGFAPTDGWIAAEVPPAVDTVAGIRQLLKDVEEMTDSLAPAFFAGQDGDHETRQALTGVFAVLWPEPVLDWYRGLAPDFFNWLTR